MMLIRELYVWLHREPHCMLHCQLHKAPEQSCLELAQWGVTVRVNGSGVLEPLSADTLQKYLTVSA